MVDNQSVEMWCKEGGVENDGKNGLKKEYFSHFFVKNKKNVDIKRVFYTLIHTLSTVFSTMRNQFHQDLFLEVMEKVYFCGG